MVEQKRTQLFMMLVQQAGVGSLPLSQLTRGQFLGFMRKIEQAAHAERAPIIVYWSSRNSRWLLPENAVWRQLTRDSSCVSVFSEERDDKQEEFCFMVVSQGLCQVLYGHSSEEHGGDVFQCVGSINPEMVRRSFQMMLPVWQFLDLGETNKLEDARINAGAPNTTADKVQGIRSAWPVVKMPPVGGQYISSPQTDSGDRISGYPVPAPTGGTGSKPRNVVDIRAGSNGPSLAEISQYLEPETNFVETAYVGGSVGGGELATLAPPVPTPVEDDVNFLRGVGGADRPKREKRDTKSLRGLRQVWTTITEESRDVFPPDAQRIIRDMFGQLRHSSDHNSILQLAIEELIKVAHADRGLIWQVVGDQLVVTHEYAIDGSDRFLKQRLGPTESSGIISEFLSRFPDETGTGVIAISDTRLDSDLHKKSPTLHTLLELTGCRARVVSQLRCTGRFHGFLELQQSSQRDWSELDAALLQSVAETLSIVVQQAFDLEKREMDADEMKLINTISELFRESKGQRSKDTLSRSVQLVADHMGFINAQIYLLNEEERLLVPQIASGEHTNAISLASKDSKDNPFVQVCEGEGKGKVRIINVEYTHKGDPFFNHDMALVVPLESEGETLGVLGLWDRDAQASLFRAGDDPKLAQTISNNLASIIRADQAIAQIRADRAREQLMNRVAQVIKSSQKEVDLILETLVQELHEHLGLGLCAVSLYDGNSQAFVKSKVAGDLSMPADLQQNEFAEHLFKSVLPDIGKSPVLNAGELKSRLDKLQVATPADAKMATVFPLIHREKLKAALCLVSSDSRPRFSAQDMNMIQTIAEGVAVDIANKELFEQIERQAVTDPMTGLHNRRFFEEQLSKEIDRNQRFGHPFSYIILDLDFLKKINDNLGHQFGDMAIKHIANVIKKCVRDVDTTARYGGEEFVVLLPETDVSGARIVAERMCLAIRENEVEGIGVVTASVGVSTFPYDAQDRDKLSELADQALYLAKHRGRNMVCSVSEDLLPSLNEAGDEALEVQQQAIKAKAEELATIDLKVIAEHGLLGILGAIIKMIEAKDAYANDRSPRATEYAGKIAQSLHLSKEHTTIISLAAILHNIGKIGISEEILQKKEALTAEERAIIETSPSIGAKILEPAKHLHRVAAVVEAYHEHWDGTGYPKGLKGEQIPLEARIIALVDAFVAMTSDRPYRSARSVKEATDILQAGAEKEWDPRLVKLFVSVLNKETKS